MVRSFLARSQLTYIHRKKTKRRILHKGIYKSTHYGHCNFFITLIPRGIIEIVLRSVKNKLKVLQRQYTFDELNINFGCEDDHFIKKRVFDVFGQQSGNIYQDFFELGSPVTAVEQLLLESQRNASILQKSIEHKETAQNSSFVNQFEDLLASQRSIQILRNDLKSDSGVASNLQKSQILIGITGNNQSMISEIKVKENGVSPLKEEPRIVKHSGMNVEKIQAMVRGFQARKEYQLKKRERERGKLVQKFIKKVHLDAKLDIYVIGQVVLKETTIKLKGTIKKGQTSFNDCSIQDLELSLKLDEIQSMEQLCKFIRNNMFLTRTKNTNVLEIRLPSLDANEIQQILLNTNRSAQSLSLSRRQIPQIQTDLEDEVNHEVLLQNTNRLSQRSQKLNDLMNKSLSVKKDELNQSMGSVKGSIMLNQSQVIQSLSFRQQRSIRSQVLIKSIASSKKGTPRSGFESQRKILLKQSQIKLVSQVNERETMDQKAIMKIQRWFRKQIQKQRLNQSLLRKKALSQSNPQQDLQQLHLMIEGERKKQLLKASTIIQKSFRGMQGREQAQQEKRHKSMRQISKFTQREFIKVGRDYFNLRIRRSDQDSQGGLDINYLKLKSKETKHLYYPLKSQKEKFFYDNDPKGFVQNVLKKNLILTGDGSLVHKDQIQFAQLKEEIKEQEDKELEHSVLKIQSVFRGKKVRKQIEEQKAETLPCFGGIEEKQKEEEQVQINEDDPELEKTVVKIQSVFRGAKVRKQKLNQNQEKEKEDKELEQQVVKIQSVFRGKKARNDAEKMKQENKEMEKQVVKIQSVFRGKQTRQKVNKTKEEKVKVMVNEAPEKNIIEQQETEEQKEELSKQVVKIQSAFRGKKARDEVRVKFSEKDHIVEGEEKELLYIYQADVFENDIIKTKKAQVYLYINKSNNMVNLKSDSFETLALYLNDYLARYKKNSSQFENTEQCYSFLRETLPKVTQIANNQIKILELQQEWAVVHTSISQEFNYSSLDKDQLNELLGSSTLGDNFQSGLDKSLKDGRSIFQQTTQIQKNLIIQEKTMTGLRFGSGLSDLNIVIFKDMLLNMFTRIRQISNSSEACCVERISEDQIKAISGKTDVKEQKDLASILLKELDIRIGIMNSSLEEDEFLNFKDIHKLLSAFSFRKTEQELQKLSDIESKAIKIQKVFRAKSKNKKPEEEKGLSKPNHFLEISNWENGNDLVFRKSSANTIELSLSFKGQIIDSRDSLIPIRQNPNECESFCRNSLAKCYGSELNKTTQKFELTENSQALQSLVKTMHLTSKAYLKSQTLSQLDEVDEASIIESVSPKVNLKKSGTFNYSNKEVKILKERTVISGVSCVLEGSLNYGKDVIKFFVKSVNPKLEFTSVYEVTNAQLRGKTLEQINEEVRELIPRLEIDKKNQNQLFLRENQLNDYSILSSDVIYKKGKSIQSRFFIITVAIEEKHMVIDAYEEKSKKRLELRIKRDKNRTGTPDHKEIAKIVAQLDLRRLGDESGLEGFAEEILVLKA